SEISLVSKSRRLKEIFPPFRRRLSPRIMDSRYMESSTKLLTSDVARILNCTGDNVRYLERTGQLQAQKLPAAIGSSTARTSTVSPGNARNASRRGVLIGEGLVNDSVDEALRLLQGDDHADRVMAIEKQ